MGTSAARRHGMFALALLATPSIAATLCSFSNISSPKIHTYVHTDHTHRVGCCTFWVPLLQPHISGAQTHQSSRAHLNAAKHNTSQVGPHQDIRHAHVHVNAINQGAPSLSTLSLAPARQPLSHRRLEAVLDKLARVARLHPHALRHRRPLRRVHLEQEAEVVEPASRGDLG